METQPAQALPATKTGLSPLQILLILIGSILLVSALVSAAVIGWFNYNFNPMPLQPVVLSEVEQQAFTTKLAALGDPALVPVLLKFPAHGPASAAAPTTPSATRQSIEHSSQKLTASAAAPTTPSATAAPTVPAGLENKTLILTEREVNAYLASQNLGENIQVSFGEGQVITAIIVKVPTDFPILSGQKMRARITFGTGLTPERKLSLVFNDLHVGGISLPNAWLGDLKGVDLIAENLQHDPALQRFLSGIRSLEIHPEGARVILNE